MELAHEERCTYTNRGRHCSRKQRPGGLRCQLHYDITCGHSRSRSQRSPPPPPPPPEAPPSPLHPLPLPEAPHSPPPPPAFPPPPRLPPQAPPSPISPPLPPQAPLFPPPPPPSPPQVLPPSPQATVSPAPPLPPLVPVVLPPSLDLLSPDPVYLPPSSPEGSSVQQENGQQEQATCMQPLSCAEFQQPCGHSWIHPYHMGACPPCMVRVTSTCLGGHVSLNIPCIAKDTIQCNSLCGQTLNCGIHVCSRTCHGLPCAQCYDCMEMKKTKSFQMNDLTSCRGLKELKQYKRRERPT